MYTQIITPTQPKTLIDIPIDMVGKPVKVTVDPMKEEEKPIFRTVEEVHAHFKGVTIDTRGWKFNRDEANER